MLRSGVFCENVHPLESHYDEKTVDTYFFQNGSPEGSYPSGGVWGEAPLKIIAQRYFFSYAARCWRSSRIVCKNNADFDIFRKFAVYGISINELLAGERIRAPEFQKAADENVIAVLKEAEEKQRKFERNMQLLLAATTIIAITIMILLSAGQECGTDERIRHYVAIGLVWLLTALSNTVNIVAAALGKERYHSDDLNTVQNRIP